MKSSRKAKRSVAAETIARLADTGKDVSRFFTHSGHMMGPIQRVNVDFASPMLDELDKPSGRPQGGPNEFGGVSSAGFRWPTSPAGCCAIISSDTAPTHFPHRQHPDSPEYLPNSCRCK